MLVQSKINLLDYDVQTLSSLLQDMGAKACHGARVFQAIHQYGLTDISMIANIGDGVVARLSACAEVGVPAMDQEHISQDGTRKWSLRLLDGNCIETVFIPEDDRGTLCISSQVGCGLNCSFCATARQGFSRNLTVAEIIGQLWFATRRLSLSDGHIDRQITNVVMMGMGEPLLNLENVVTAMAIMQHDLAYGLSKYRVTLSTSGLVPAMQRLATLSDVSLAVSLHAPTDELRNQLVPINKKYPLHQLLAVCRDYFRGRDQSRREIVMEYVMLADVNDRLEHAKTLAKRLQDVPAKVNLIPFNPFPNSGYRCSDMATITEFKQILHQAGINTIVRKTRGADIAAACGQLTGSVLDRTGRSQRILKNYMSQGKS